MEDKEKVVIYLKPNDEENLKQQKERINDFCKKNNLEIDTCFTDYDDNHSSIEEMFDYVMNNDIETIVVSSIFVLSENAFELYDYLKYTKDFCNIMSVKELSYEIEFEMKTRLVLSPATNMATKNYMI